MSNQERFITIGELEKIFNIFSNSIDCKSLCKMQWNLKKKVSNLIKTNQWLWCWEQTWFNIIDTLHAISINQNIFYERIIITWETCH